MDLFTKIKSITSFTESEQIFIQYILDHPYDVIQLSLQQLAKTSYVSILVNRSINFPPNKHDFYSL